MRLALHLSVHLPVLRRLARAVVRSGRATAPLRVLQVESTFLSAILLVENNAPPVRHVAQEQSRSFGQTAKPEQARTDPDSQADPLRVRLAYRRCSDRPAVLLEVSRRKQRGRGLVGG
jgi:hypothetical protein